MKKIIIILALASITILGYSQAQTGGEISGKTVKGTRHSVNIDSTAPNRFWLSVFDSLSHVYLSGINTKIPSGLTVNSNRLAIYSPDSIRVFATNGFGSGGGGGAVTIDTTLYAKKVISLGTGGNTIGAISNTSFGVTNAGTFAVQNTPSATDSSKYRSTFQISNFPAVSLPTGAATSALQTTGNTALELMDDVVNTNGAVHGTRSFLVAGSDGARARALLTNTSGNLETKAWSVDSAIFASINSKLGGTLTVGSHAVTNAGTFAVQATQSGTWNVNNVSGTVSLPTGAATEATLYNIFGEILDQGSNYLSPTKLKTDSIYTRLGTGVTVNSHPVTNAGTFPVQVDSSTQRRGVVVLNTVPVTGTFTSSVPTYSVTGTITTQNLSPTRTETAGSAVSANCDGYSTASIKVRGTYTGALTIQYSNDDSTWTTSSASLTRLTGGFTQVTTITSADTNLWIVPTYSFKRIRVTGLSAMSGSASVFIVLNNGTNMVFINPTQTINVTTAAGSVSSNSNAAQFVQEDFASGDAFSGNKLLGVRSDTLTSSTTSANGDWSQITTTKSGVLLTKDEMRHRVTYRATSGSFTPAASATDIFTITGVASKTIMITKIIFSATQTAGGTFNVSLIKRSTANTSGTAQDMTAVPLDASDAAAGSIVRYYTANPTLGTTIASIETVPIFCSATTAQPEKYEFNFGENGKPVILNSASQALSLNFGGVTMTGGACFVTIQWTETW